MQRHNQLLELEKSLTEVRDMFIQISTLVMDQGSLIQVNFTSKPQFYKIITIYYFKVIEHEVENAQNEVDKGANELDKARELQIKALKKKTYILIILLIILGVLILILIIT